MRAATQVALGSEPATTAASIGGENKSAKSVSPGAREIVRSLSKACQHLCSEPETAARSGFRRAGWREQVGGQDNLRSSRRRILPEAVLGTASTKRTSRGCL